LRPLQWRERLPRTTCRFSSSPRCKLSCLHARKVQPKPAAMALRPTLSLNRWRRWSMLLRQRPMRRLLSSIRNVCQVC
jgi:hypothetical protein